VVGAVVGFAAPSSFAGPDFTVVDHSVAVDKADMTATFSITFDQKPEFVAVDNGQPNAFQIEVDADTTNLDRAIEWSDIDTVIRGGEIWEGNGIPVRERDGDGGANAGGWGPLRALLPYDVAGNTVTFTAGLTAIGDDDGAFRYRVISTTNGEMTGSSVGVAVIPFPAAVWTGLSMLGGISIARKTRLLARV
jgi:hypothetical protein